MIAVDSHADATRCASTPTSSSPAEAYPEKEGTLVHPDGRVQRLRPAIGRARGPAASRLAACAPPGRSSPRSPRALGLRRPASRTGAHGLAAAVRRRAVLRGPDARRDRRPRRALARARAGLAWAPALGADAKLERPAGGARRANGRCGSAPSAPLWASKEVDVSPALHFLRARQVVELSPEDADALGIRDGDRVEVGQRHARPGRRRSCAPRSRAGRSSSPRARASTPANAAHRAASSRSAGRRAAPTAPSAVAAQVAPAAEGLAETPASAPLPIPPTPESR